jgi:uncharacterized protein
VVVDTNVFVSAILKPNSVPYLAAQLVHRDETLLKSALTEEELRRVLARPIFTPYLRASASAWIDQMMQAAQLVPMPPRIAASRDPADDKFLDLAVAGRAHLVISGDDDLLSLTRFFDIPIITPATFVRARRT